MTDPQTANHPNSAAPVAIITGAARGIGLATAEKFLAEGWRVVLIDWDAETLAATGKRLANASALPILCDVSKADQVEKAVNETIASFGRIDALVNNAGIAVFKPIMDTTLEEWNAVMAVNLTGPFICTQAVAPHMLKSGGGAIVNIASISGMRASSMRVAYGTSKAALMHLTRQQAMELGLKGIRVNAVSPGPVDTAMAKQVHTPDVRRGYYDAIPMGRYGEETELANAIFFLASPAASYINGQTLAVDGGFDAVGIGLPSLRGEM